MRAHGFGLLAVVLVLSACTPTDDASSPPPEESSSVSEDEPDSPRDQKFVRPTLRLSPDDALFLVLAQETLVSRCMAERGFLYEVAELPPASEAFENRPSRWNSAFDVETARLEGYGIYRSMVGSDGDTDEEGEFDIAPGKETGPNAHVASLPPEQQAAWREALHGTEEHTLEVPGAGEAGGAAFMRTDGCVAEMERALYGDLEEFLRLETAIGAALNSQQYDVFSDERVVAAGSEWMACMANRGYAVDSQDGGNLLAREAYEERPLDTARQVEIAIAVADAECLEESRVNEILQDVMLKQEEALVRDNAALFAELRRIQEEAVARGRALLDEG